MRATGSPNPSMTHSTCRSRDSDSGVDVPAAVHRATADAPRQSGIARRIAWTSSQICSSASTSRGSNLRPRSAMQ